VALLTLKPLYQCAGAFFISWQKSLPDKHHFMAAMPSPALATVAGFFIWSTPKGGDTAWHSQQNKKRSRKRYLAG
jgi:hypothetical protein